MKKHWNPEKSVQNATKYSSGKTLSTCSRPCVYEVSESCIGLSSMPTSLSKASLPTEFSWSTKYIFITHLNHRFKHGLYCQNIERKCSQIIVLFWEMCTKNRLRLNWPDLGALPKSHGHRTAQMGAPASRSWLLFLKENKDFNQDATFLGKNINIYVVCMWPPALSPEIPDGRDLTL